MKHDVMEIDVAKVPYEFDILLAGELFRIGVNYNETAKFFTLNLAKKDKETGNYTEICPSEPVVYGVPLWNDVYKNGRFPAVTIIPLDESGENNAVTFDNLNRTVFLALDNGES